LEENTTITALVGRAIVSKNLAEKVENKIPISLTNAEYFKYSRELDTHHALFYKMWEMGKPFFDTSIQTAAVRFDRDGQQVSYLFNPDFWNSLSDYERIFIICHESLHVILNHGYRTKDTDNMQKANIALDIVVNHTLVRKFGFDRTKLSMEKDMCWTDTIFPNEQVPDNECFEYYYKKIKDDNKFDSIDDHSGLSMSAEEWQDVIDSIGDQLTNEEKESLEQMMQKHFETKDQKDKDEQESNNKPGVLPGCGWKIIKVPVVVKKKWETVIKKWSKKYDKTDMFDVEQWARTNRRFTALATGGLFLPTEMEVEFETDGKIDVWFFQDTSGSCYHLAERFFKAASSLNPKVFNIRLFCFDTKVYETTLKSGKLYGFGGTMFNIIEQYIQGEISSTKQKYPSAVFVITDGYGNLVKPQYPKQWYWFLSTDYRYCIPQECNVFQLKNFE
jgi:hypothetical protein